MKAENSHSIKIARLLAEQVGSKISNWNLVHWIPFNEVTVGFSIIKDKFRGSISIADLKDKTYLLGFQVCGNEHMSFVRLREKDLGRFIDSIENRIVHKSQVNDIVPRSAMEMSAN